MVDYIYDYIPDKNEEIEVDLENPENNWFDSTDTYYSTSENSFIQASTEELFLNENHLNSQLDNVNQNEPTVVTLRVKNTPNSKEAYETIIRIAKSYGDSIKLRKARNIAAVLNAVENYGSNFAKARKASFDKASDIIFYYILYIANFVSGTPKYIISSEMLHSKLICDVLMEDAWEKGLKYDIMQTPNGGLHIRQFKKEEEQAHIGGSLESIEGLSEEGKARERMTFRSAVLQLRREGFTKEIEEFIFEGMVVPIYMCATISGPMFDAVLCFSRYNTSGSKLIRRNAGFPQLHGISFCIHERDTIYYMNKYSKESNFEFIFKK